MKQHPLTYALWGLLAASAITALIFANWSKMFITLVTLVLAVLPVVGQRWADMHAPRGFIASAVFFIVATIFLGEVRDFYERFAWWDMFLHTGSAVGFGMIGTVLVLFLVEDAGVAPKAWLAALLSFSFAVSIGAIWELFEFSIDQILETSMQRSGLVDTMSDMALNCLGGLIGAIAGWSYIRGARNGPLSRAIASFVERNKDGPANEL